MSPPPRAQEPRMAVTHSQPENAQFDPNWAPVPTGDGGRGAHLAFRAGRHALPNSRPGN